MNPKPRSSATPKAKAPRVSAKSKTTAVKAKVAPKARAAAKVAPPAEPVKPAPVARKVKAPASLKPRAAPAKVAPPAKSATRAQTPPEGSSLAFLAQQGAQEPVTPATPTQVAFVNEYLKDMNGTAAYRRVHPTAKVSTCAVEASRILKNPKVRALIEQERQKLERFGMTKEEVVSELVAIVRANPAELSQLRHVTCGDCWGGEDKPGRWTEPDPDCTTCAGEGVADVFFADTRKLSPGALRLFVSVERTRNGIKLHTESKAAALDKLAKILGAYELDNTQKVNPLLELLQRMGGSALPVVKNAGRDGN